MGLLRSLLLGTSLGIWIGRLRQCECLWSLGQCRLRLHPSWVGQSVYRELWDWQSHCVPKYAGYNPQTGVVAGGGTGYAGNVYSGQGAAARGGLAYNTNTGGGVAVGGTNVYARKDGTVYRYDRQNKNWSQNTGSRLAVLREAPTQPPAATAST